MPLRYLYKITLIWTLLIGIEGDDEHEDNAEIMRLYDQFDPTTPFVDSEGEWIARSNLLEIKTQHVKHYSVSQLSLIRRHAFTVVSSM